MVELDHRKWDYKHQVLATRHLSPWLVITLVKLMEVAMQLRPRALWRALCLPDPKLRDAQRWYYRVGRRVWFSEWASFLFRERRAEDGPTVRERWGAPQVHEEAPLAIERRRPGLEPFERPYVPPVCPTCWASRSRGAPRGTTSV